VVERLNDLREQQKADTATLTAAIESLRSEMTAQRESYVLRSEWTQRNAQVDERTAGLGREIGTLRTAHAADIAAIRGEMDAAERARRVPWTAVGSLVIAAASLLIVLLRLPL